MGLAFSAFTESFPPESKFSVDDIPDLTDKVIIVTGANTGVGKETVKTLLLHNAKVYMACRNKQKAESAIEELREQTGKDAIFLGLDLADLHSVKSAAEEFQRQERVLHVLFNNAGILFPADDEAVTAQGYDLQFGTNVIGHFYFTKLLLPELLAGAKSSMDGKARVMTTASIGHLAGRLDFKTFKDGPARQRCNKFLLYCQSKYGDIVFANELARRYGDQGIVSMSCHPGNLRSDLFRNLPWLMSRVVDLFLYPLECGALTQLWGGTTAAGAHLNGKYLIPWARVGRPLPSTQDAALGRVLWHWLEEQVENI